MSSRTSFVEINGNRYDATTGNIISAIKTANKKGSQVIDGFVKAPLKITAQKPLAKNTHHPAQPSHHRASSAELHYRAEKTHTLMRKGLKKPARQLQSNLQRLAPKGGIERELRAKLTPRHNRVNRFGVPRPAIGSRQTSPATKKPLSGELVNRNHSVQSAASVAAPLPSMVTSVSHQKLERLLDEALVRADAHKAALRYQAARHFWQRRWFSGPRRWAAVAISLFILVVAAFIAWQKVPQVSIKAAGMQAHLTPSVPAYKPDGFTMAGPAAAHSGMVTIQYKSVTGDGNTYTVNQAQSDLTSSSLAQNMIPKGTAVQTSQVEGNTVYIYGADNDAAWVNNGVLYTIKDQANLSSDELLNIVRGLNQ